ncbi:MAG: hypothetical protein DRR16_02595 [Candidatus Parabeggiatoa sp. nov. 3]|nr:MAG: hypothetical protein DRR00_10570 [Gammaproteobacteria bacterium]RKZ65780.1 MAG: hypothetical protein DRQ99_11745 [Gammaproteobacteria bacterium]RKZ89377.1 MAG: hypothetical protein DRR16_02595 [Gammaproteobacteria bacterium]
MPYPRGRANLLIGNNNNRIKLTSFGEGIVIFSKKIKPLYFLNTYQFAKKIFFNMQGFKFLRAKT